MTNVVGFIYTEFNDNVCTQLVRDLLILLGTFEFAVSDPNAVLTDEILEQLGLICTSEKPTINLVYKTSKDWPDFPYSVPYVKRDLCPDDIGMGLEPNPTVGYYLKEQGRDGANRTEQYLNRMHPKGQGIVNPLILLMWG